jgi:hypothetical protein
MVNIIEIGVSRFALTSKINQPEHCVSKSQPPGAIRRACALVVSARRCDFIRETQGDDIIAGDAVL